MCSRTILITGASRGLGRHLAEKYLDMGCFVFGCSRKSDKLISHASYRHFEVDVGNEAAVASMMREIDASRKGLQLLINNAGITQSSLAIMTRSAVAEEVIRTNLLGTFLVSREVMKIMQRQKQGRIVNFSSINVPLGSSGSCIYNATKAGVEALAIALTREVGKADVTINTLGLSLVAATGMLEGLSGKALSEKQVGLLKPAVLETEEIIHAIEFLASNLARNISGQTIYFGGL